MSKKTMMTWTAAGCLLVGLFGARGSAQSSQDGSACYINTGLFTVARGEGVSFHVSLDDRRTGPPATVLLRLFNEQGLVVARQDVTLEAGQSTTLQTHGPGRYRAHAQSLEPSAPASERRTVLGTVEIFRAMSAASGLPDDRGDSNIVRVFFAHDDGRGSTCPH